MTDAVRCAGVSKSYRSPKNVGIKELLVGRHRRQAHGFGREWAVQDVSFTLAKGRALGVLGTNGSGKSTLLALLLGVIRPDRGLTEVNGRVASLLALGAGFHPELTGRQNVFLYSSILGMRFAETRAVFDRIVAFSEIGDAIDNPIRTYSSGMITRLGFSTIVHTPADVLLIDEVLGVGDKRFQLKCRDFLVDFRRRQGTLIIVSHDLRSLGELCDDGLWIADGRVVEHGPIASVVAAYTSSPLTRLEEVVP